MPVLRSGEAVDDFIQRAVAAAGDDQAAAIADGLLRDFDGVAGAGGLSELGFNTVRSENAARLIEKLAAAIAAITRVGIVDEERVVKSYGHRHCM